MHEILFSVLFNLGNLVKLKTFFFNLNFKNKKMFNKLIVI